MQTAINSSGELFAAGKVSNLVSQTLFWGIACFITDMMNTQETVEQNVYSFIRIGNTPLILNSEYKNNEKCNIHRVGWIKACV